MKSSAISIEQSIVKSRKDTLDLIKEKSLVENHFDVRNIHSSKLYCTKKLNHVFNRYQRAIWLMKKDKIGDIVNIKWDLNHIQAFVVFDDEIIVTSRKKLKLIIESTINSALESFNIEDSSNFLLVSNFGNDMNTYLWEEVFESLF